MAKKIAFRPGDFFIFAVILAFSIFAFTFISTETDKGKVVVQSIDGIYEYSLGTEGFFDIPGPLGYTTIEIKDGEVRIADSPCPNKTCVAQGWTSPVICLPQHITVFVQKTESENEEGDFDGITR